MRKKLFGLLAVAVMVMCSLALAPAANAKNSKYSDMIGIKKDGTLWVYTNTGNSSAPFSGGSRQLGHGWNVYDNVFAADLNNDNRVDLIGHDKYGQDTQVYQNSNGQYPGTSRYNGGYLRAIVNVPLLPKSADVLEFGYLGERSLGINNVSSYLVVDSEGSLLRGGVQSGVVGSTFPGGTTKTGHGWQNFTSINLADVNKDGFDDLVGLTSDGGLHYYQNTTRYSNATLETLKQPIFMPGKKIGHGWNVFNKVLVEDVNNDGYADIVARKTDGTLWQYLNSKNNTRPYSSNTKIGHGWNAFETLHLGNVR